MKVARGFLIATALELSSMILRLTQNLNTMLKSGKLSEMPLDRNPYADWSCNLFFARRTQFIILMNTASLYTCLLPGRVFTSASIFSRQSLKAIRKFTATDAKQAISQNYIQQSAGTISFAKSLNRSVKSSANDHIVGARVCWRMLFGLLLLVLSPMIVSMIFKSQHENKSGILPSLRDDRT